MLAWSASAKSARGSRAARRRARNLEGRAGVRASSGASDVPFGRADEVQSSVRVRRRGTRAAEAAARPSVLRGLAVSILRGLRRARREPLLQGRDALARPGGGRARALHRADVLLCGVERLDVLALALAHAAKVCEELRTLVAQKLDGARKRRVGLLKPAEMFVVATEMVEGYRVARRLAAGDDEQRGDRLVRALE